MDVLTVEEQIDKLRNIQAQARADYRVVKCTGTYSEYEDYLAGSDDLGWNVEKGARKHDLLCSAIRRGRAQELWVVSVCLVVAKVGGHHQWESDSDVAIDPALRMADVLARGGLPSPMQQVYKGDDAGRLVDGIADALQDAQPLELPEQERKWQWCQPRSPALRRAKLADSDGTCEVCSENYPKLFPTRGNTAVDVHHIEPLSGRLEVGSTSTDDLAVLCATCHRLLHADPKLDMERLRLEWDQARSGVE